MDSLKSLVPLIVECYVIFTFVSTSMFLIDMCAIKHISHD